MAKGSEDEIGRLGTVQAAPGPVGFEDPVDLPMAGPAQRGEIPVGFVAEAGVAAVVEVVPGE